MATKTELEKILKRVIADSRYYRTSRFAPPVVPGTMKIRATHRNKAIDLLSQISTLEAQSEDIQKLTKEVYDIEGKVFWVSQFNKILSVSYLFLLICIPLLGLIHTGVLQFVFCDVFWFNEPEMQTMIAIGITGVIISSVVRSLKEIENKPESQSSFWTRFVSFVLRLLVAFTVPMVLISLFLVKKTDGEDGTIDATVNACRLIAFAAGYSTRFVVVLLRTIMERAECALAVFLGSDDAANQNTKADEKLNDERAGND